MFTLTRPFNSWDAMKLLALALMFIDHAGAFFFRDAEYQWLRAIGRGAAPIFLFLSCYALTFRFKWDLFILALMMSVSDYLLVGHLRAQNILVTILITRLFFYWWDKHGKVVEHPYEWVLGGSIWFLTTYIMQYGIFGFVLGLCAYVKRRPHIYPAKVAHNMLMMAFVAFGIVTQLMFHFSHYNYVIMVVTLAITCWLLMHMQVRDIDTSRLPQPLVWAAQKSASYSGYIYALHLIALEWITGIPF